jgi:hypothetical protein
MRKLIVPVLAFAALILAPPAAESASRSECFGQRPNVLGTKGNDEIVVYTDGEDETVTYGTINGVAFDVDGEDPVIFSDKGNDRITVFGDEGHSGDVCAGAGKDYVSGIVRRVHAGDGYDTVEATSLCGWRVQAFRAEAVLVDVSFDEGPCN